MAIKKILHLFCLSTFVFLCVFTTSIHAFGDEVDRELKIKVAYLFHFAQFTEWSPKPATFNYCIYEDAKFNQLLKEIYTDKTLNGATIDTNLISLNSNINNCHLIFFPDFAPQELVSKIRKKPILSVGTHKEFINQGGIVYLFEKDQKIRFYIDNHNATESGLKISSQLLALSKDPSQ